MGVVLMSRTRCGTDALTGLGSRANSMQTTRHASAWRDENVIGGLPSAVLVRCRNPAGYGSWFRAAATLQCGGILAEGAGYYKPVRAAIELLDYRSPAGSSRTR